jgi:hypothetical protein
MTTLPVEGPNISTSRCVFLDGEHLFAGPDCPHQEPPKDDERPVGWTVQQ